MTRARWRGLDRHQTYECAECHRRGSGNYFLTSSLCKKCAARERHRQPNPPIQLSPEILVTRNVEKRLTKIAAATVPPSTAEKVGEWAVRTELLLFWVSGPFVQYMLFDEWTGVRWFFILGWMMFVPFGIALAIDKATEKPRRERREQVRSKVLALAEERQRQIEDRRMFYASPEWKLLRDQIIREQGRVCSHCGMQIKKDEDITIDHKHPRSKHPELALRPDNLRVLCRRCNSQKGARDWIDA